MTLFLFFTYAILASVSVKIGQAFDTVNTNPDGIDDGGASGSNYYLM